MRVTAAAAMVEPWTSAMSVSDVLAFLALRRYVLCVRDRQSRSQVRLRLQVFGQSVPWPSKPILSISISSQPHTSPSVTDHHLPSQDLTVGIVPSRQTLDSASCRYYLSFFLPQLDTPPRSSSHFHKSLSRIRHAASPLPLPSNLVPITQPRNQAHPPATRFTSSSAGPGQRQRSRHRRRP